MLGRTVKIDIKSLKFSKWVLLLIFICLTAFLEFYSDDLITNVIGLVLLCGVSLILCGFNPSHPYFWFSTFFTLYSISYPILHYMKFTEFIRYGYSPEIMRLQWVALSTFLLVFSPTCISKINTSCIKSTNSHWSPLFSKANKYLLYALEIVLLLISVKIAFSGYSSKKDIQAAGDIFFSIGERLAMFLAIDFALFFASSLANGKKIKKIFLDILLCAVSISAFVLFTGDRSTLFRFIFYLGLSMFAFHRLKPRHLLLIIPLMIVVLTASNVFRYILMKRDASFSLFTNGRDFLYDFLTSDFQCAARNLQVLVNDASNTKGKYGYSLLFSDVLFVFFRNIGLFSASTWFNKTYFSGSIYGQAFTLVGQGYIIDGYFGVIVLFVVIALLIKFLYLKSSKNVYWFVIYIVAAAGTSFALREMFMSVLSPIIRQGLPVIIIAYFLNETDNKKLHSYTGAKMKVR